MKTLVVYFSLGKNTALVADTLQSALKADVLEIKLLKDRRPGPITFLWAILQSMGKKTPVLKPYSADIGAYDLIVLGAPIWASTPASPLRAFLSKTTIVNKKVALFCCHAGSPGSALDEIKAMVPGNTVVAERAFDFSARSGAAATVREKIEAWAAEIAAAR